MELESIVEVMINKKYMLGMGAKAVASRMSKILNKPCTKDQIKEAKVIAKNRINFGTDYHPKDVAFVESKPTNKLVKHPPEIIINDRRLIIGDLHEPFTLEGYLDFCKSIYDEYNCNSVIFIGDIIDNHFSSFHESDPDGLGAMEELNRAKANIKKWHSVFPNAKVCVGNHDCYDEDTEILTEYGWIKGVDLIEGIRVGTMDLDSGVFEYQTPSAIINKRYIGELIEYKDSDNTDLLVTPNHRMVYQDKDNTINDRNYKVSPAVNVQAGYKYFPISCENPNEDYDISDDEIKLLAWIASDGSVRGNNGYTIYQSKIDKSKVIEELLESLGIQYQKTTRIRNIDSICGIKLKKDILPANEYRFKEFLFEGEYNNKYKIPTFAYKFSQRQFDIFINSYIDGDGSRKYNLDGTAKRGCMIYGLEGMLKQLQILCVMNNAKTSITKYREKDFRLNIILNKKNTGFHTGKSKVIDYDGRVWCATVPNTTLVIRRNSKVQIQGNCLPERKAFAAGLSKTWVKSIGEVLDTPTWMYSDAFIINGVQYTHGTGRKAAGRMRSDLTSIVQGHYHAESYIQYSAGKFKNLFAMQIGCGADSDSYALAYGKHFDAMHINCGVVLKDGTSPKIEYMNKY